MPDSRPSKEGQAPEPHSVYILKCSDSSYYTGCTNNLDDRLKRHKLGQVHYTKSRLPFEIVVTINFPDRYKAYAFEKYLKSGSGRAFAKRHLL
ncbi:MAG: GIY-YIG nuclease family protein [Cyclobacteriaceae bacterium]